MSEIKCYDCSTVLCKECTRIHNEENKHKSHVMQPVSDYFVLNCKFIVENDIDNERVISDIKCLPNGEVIIAVYRKQEVLIFSVRGTQRHVIQLENCPRIMDVVGENTVAVLLDNSSVAIVNIQPTHVQYISNTEVKRDLSSFIYTDNLLYFANNEGIKVLDMLGTEKRRIDLNFTPKHMCYDVASQRIYCIDRFKSKLVCIDKDGYIIFTFVDPIWTSLKNLTIDNKGNVLLLRKIPDDGFNNVIKVDSNGTLSDFEIRNIKLSRFYQDSCICFHHLTNSIVIGVDDTVYIYKKEANV